MQFAALQSSECFKNEGVLGFLESLCQWVSAKSHGKKNVHLKRGLLKWQSDASFPMPYLHLNRWHPRVVLVLGSFPPHSECVNRSISLPGSSVSSGLLLLWCRTGHEKPNLRSSVSAFCGRWKWQAKGHFWEPVTVSLHVSLPALWLFQFLFLLLQPLTLVWLMKVIE